MKRMLLVNGSPRSDGSSAELLNMVSEKAAAAGYECERIDLGKLNISHCKGCLSCKETGECAVKDDMSPLYKKFQDADAFTVSVPVYFGNETGLLKNFIDRLYALMKMNADGSWNVRFGNVKKGVVALNCGAPDGNMIYHGAMTHLVIIMRMFGMTDVASGIVPAASSAPVRESQFTKDLMGSIDFLLSS
ncbi:MAG: flavodoxin family protein [Methanomassiliicoccaceae archaeon]|nr:flavodoxin family protein [Methanomassiliicoccaceae archaeon]